jgi:predicted dehydrogenase
MTTFKVALVGLGEIAEKRYARLIKRNPAVQLAVVCSRRAETAQALRRGPRPGPMDDRLRHDRE